MDLRRTERHLIACVCEHASACIVVFVVTKRNSIIQKWSTIDMARTVSRIITSQQIFIEFCRVHWLGKRRCRSGSIFIKCIVDTTLNIWMRVYGSAQLQSIASAHNLDEWMKCIFHLIKLWARIFCTRTHNLMFICFVPHCRFIRKRNIFSIVRRYNILLLFLFHFEC